MDLFGAIVSTLGFVIVSPVAMLLGLLNALFGWYPIVPL